MRSRTDCDVLVPKAGRLLPCYSLALTMKSKVICQLFEDTEQDGWGAGVAGALADASFRGASLFLAICHSHADLESIMSDADPWMLLKAVKIAHKLDANGIVQVCRCRHRPLINF